MARPHRRLCPITGTDGWASAGSLTSRVGTLHMDPWTEWIFQLTFCTRAVRPNHHQLLLRAYVIKCHPEGSIR